MEQARKAGVLVAMSGGVDSSVAAYLVHRAGFPCQGVTMRLRPEDNSRNTADAEAVCQRLHIPFYVLDLREIGRASCRERV